MKHRSKKILIAVTTAGLLAGVLAGCGSGGAANPDAGGPSGDSDQIVKGGHAVFRITTDTTAAMDPVQGLGQVSRMLMDPVCERLYEEQPDGTAEPMLATEMPSVSDDNLTITVPLREGVVFNDGTPFNAEAVKFNLDRAVQDPLSVRRIAKQYIESVQVVDEYTVEISMKKPYSAIIAELTDFTGMIASPTALESKGENFTDAPVCVGPFEWTSRVPGGDTVFTKSDLYYDKDAVNLDKVTFRLITDVNAAGTNIESGDVHFGDVAPAFYARMKDSPTVHTEAVPRLGVNGFFFNIGNVAGSVGPYGTADNLMAQNPELREAFALAIDRETVAEVAVNGDAPAGCTPIWAGSVFARDIECSPFDLEKAKQLVEDSGVPTPIKVTFAVPPYENMQKTAQVVQEMVKEAGFEMEIVPQESSSFFQDMYSGNSDAAFIGLSPLNSDPAYSMAFETGDSYNWWGYSNPETDALIQAARETFDEDERAEYYKQAIEIFNDSYSYIYLGGLASYWATSDNFVAERGVSLGGTPYVKKSGFTELP